MKHSKKDKKLIEEAWDLFYYKDHTIGETVEVVLKKKENSMKEKLKKACEKVEAKHLKTMGVLYDWIITEMMEE